MTELMRRRRALMAAQVESEPLLTLADLQTGSAVKFAESGATYIYCGIMYGNAQLLRDLVIDSSNKKSTLTYSGGAVDTYLTGTWYNSFSAAQKALFVDSDVTIVVSNGSATSNATITRKVYCPPYSLVTNSGAITDVLKKYKGTTSSNTSRVAKDSGGTSRAWWTSSADDATTTGIVGGTGSLGSVSPTTSQNNYIRPVISLDKTTKVRLVGTAYILQY